MDDLGHNSTPKIGTFSGLASEHAKLWLDRYDRLADFHSWSAEKRAHGLSLYFRGPAETWFHTVKATDRNDKEKFRPLFLEQFANKASQFLIDTKFHDRKMLPGESVESFLVDLQELAAKIDKDDKQILSQFLRGLSKPIKTLVLTQSPASLALASQMAMVAESVKKEEDADQTAQLQSQVHSLSTDLASLHNKLDASLRSSAAIQQRTTYNQQSTRRDYRQPSFNDRQNYSQQPTYNTPVQGPQHQMGRPPFDPSGFQSAYRPPSRPPFRRDVNMQCWSCRCYGHRQRHCPEQASSHYLAKPSYQRCFHCNDPGHVVQNCPF